MKNITSLTGYLLYCVGYKNIYYYLTMMCACLLIFWIVDNNFHIKKIFVLITLMSLALNDVGAYDSIASALGVSYYQYFNVLNYIGVFSLGNIFREKELFQKYLSSRSIQLSSLLISLFVIAAECLIGVKMNPFIFDITNKVSWITATLFVSANCIKKSNTLIDIGKNTLFIYLYQLFLTSNILVEDEMLSNAYIAMFRPLIIVVLLYCVSKMGYLICDKISKRLACLYTICTGVK